ncbi:MAG: oligosaccharide flippase family protein [bacterium]|nr:oligosaccharide flippase family protein [bacterium]
MESQIPFLDYRLVGYTHSLGLRGSKTVGRRLSSGMVCRGFFPESLAIGQIWSLSSSRVDSRSNSRKIALGLTWKTISNCGVLGLGLITSVVLNRWYGPDQYGLLVMVFTVTSLATTCAGFGSQPTINRYIPRYRQEGRHEDAASLLVVGAVLQTIGILLFGGLILVVARPIAVKFFHRNDLVGLIIVGALAFAGFSAFSFMSNLYQALEVWHIEGFLSVLYPALYLLGVLLALAAGWGIWAALVANGLGALVTVAVGWWRLPSVFRVSLRGRLGRSVVLDHVRTIVVFGLPTLAIQTNFFLLMWFDKAWLGRHGGSNLLTYFYLATLFYTGMMVFMKALYTVYMPHVATLPLDDIEEVERQYTIVFRSFLHGAILICLVAFWWIGPAVHVLYGPGYAPTIWAFRWLLVIFILRAVFNPCGMFLQNVYANTRKAALLGTALTGTNILLDVLLIPSYGIMGAIVASIIAYIVYWVVFLIFAPEVRTLLPLAAIRRTAQVGIVILLPLLWLRGVGGGFAFSLGLGFPILYILGLKVLGEISSSDWELVRILFAAFRRETAETVA